MFYRSSNYSVLVMNIVNYGNLTVQTTRYAKSVLNMGGQQKSLDDNFENGEGNKFQKKESPTLHQCKEQKDSQTPRRDRSLKVSKHPQNLPKSKTDFFEKNEKVKFSPSIVKNEKSPRREKRDTPEVIRQRGLEKATLLLAQIDKEVSEMSISDIDQFCHPQQGLSSTPPKSFVSLLQEYTNKHHFAVIFDSEQHSLDTATLWSILKGRRNIMIVIEDTRGDVFGSFHSVVANGIGIYSQKDFSHFVFSLQNTSNCPTKFGIKKLGEVLKISGGENTLLVVNDFIQLNREESFFVTPKVFWRTFLDDTDKGTKFISGEERGFFIENVQILQWED
ncbi:hypothetical protein EIN_055190 [Entamoeba invadens IP1]|uniref:hypothetical protein n=1 Tax=Entamoeba invadens IP1 TaxID=370355 RepID=UPI0002C3F89A|nr:hypothetical protein EIN_055190 [Entamoeba invadens IP1]ELP93214.1 hypothetical protein EIN_055190 [Entamoeba invadens IP1]|eukprot:XP_004259985.1 hypothetical protein EIN_055190 [Entamoeba invadens IP1]